MDEVLIATFERKPAAGWLTDQLLPFFLFFLFSSFFLLSFPFCFCRMQTSLLLLLLSFPSCWGGVLLSTADGGVVSLQSFTGTLVFNYASLPTERIPRVKQSRASERGREEFTGDGK